MAEHYVRDDVRAFLDYLASLNQPALYEVPLDQARQARGRWRPWSTSNRATCR